MDTNSPSLPIRVGVVGAGFIGPAHIESLRRLGFVEVAALADFSQEAADKSAAKLFVPKAYGSYLDLVNDPGIDVVDICAPNILHYPITKAAVAAGKHVVSEKPLGMSSAESAELLQLAKAGGKVHAVIFNQRFYPLLQHARSIVSRGDLGAIYSVHGGFWQDWLLYETDYNWRVESAQGGALRAVGDIGSHWLDVAQFVTGKRIERLFAEIATVLPVRQKPAQAVETFSTAEVQRTPVDVDTEDAATVLLKLEGGTRGVMQVSQVSAGRKNHMTLEVNCANGSVAWDAERPNELWLGHRDRPNELLLKDPALMDPVASAIARYPAAHAEGFADTHTAIQRAIYEYIRAGGYASGRDPEFPTFAAGHLENVLGDSILKSAREERWVDVPAV